MTSNAVPVAEQCRPVTSIEVVHRVNGANATDRLRLIDDAADVPSLSLRAFQVAANYFGTANVVSSRPVTQVMCFPQQSGAARAPTAPPSFGVCVGPDETSTCPDLTPSHTYDYGGTENCTITNRTDSATVLCDDSGAIITRNGDVVLNINTQGLREDIAAKTQALRRLVGDQNVITNFHFDVSINPDQQATIVSNNGFNNIAQALQQAANAGQPLPDIQGIIHDLPDPSRTFDFYSSLVLAYATKAERLGMLAQITNGSLLSPSQVNAFYQSFVGNSKLVDKLEVNGTPTSLNQAANTVNNAINQLAQTDPSSTVYKQVKAGTDSLMQSHAPNGVYDPNKVIHFKVPNLYESTKDGDIDKRLAAAEALSDLNHQIQQPNGAQRAHDMNASLKRMDEAMRKGDPDGTFRLLQQTKATEFFFDHTDPTGTEYDVHLTPEAQALFGITVQPTSAKAFEVITVLNTVADYNAETGQVTVTFTAIFTLNARSALLTDDLYRASYHSEENWGLLSYLKSLGGAAVGAIIVDALGELALDGAGVIEAIKDGWKAVDTIRNHLRGSVSNWHDTMDLVWQLGKDIIRQWPGMTPEQASALVAQIAGQVLQTFPPAALGAAGIHEAIEAAVKLHLDKASRGLAIIEHSGVTLSEDAAVDLVKHFDEIGVTDVNKSIELADALDNDLPCSMVGALGGAAPKNISGPTDKPPCDATTIDARFERARQDATRMGVTDIQEREDLITSLENVGPGHVEQNALTSDEYAFANRVVADHDGGTFVGARVDSHEAIDGFYKGSPAQLKVSASTSPAAIATKAKEIEDAAANYREIDGYLHMKNLTRDQVIQYARNGPTPIIVGRNNKIRFLEILTSDGFWVHVENGVVR